MSIYIIPAILAFIVNCFVLIKIKQNKKQSKAFIGLVLIFLVHHTAEILSFIEFFKNGQIIYVLKIYYIATLWFLVVTLIYANEISQVNSQLYKIIAISLTIPVSIFIMFSSSIITGANSLGYVMTAVKGPYYFLFQSLVIGFLVSVFILLFNGYKNAKNSLIEIQCIYMLLAFIPILIAGIGIVLVMALGFKVNAIAIIPIATSLFLVIVMKSEHEHKLTDIRRFMPFSSERQTSHEIMEIYSNYSQDEISYRECITKIEKLLVLHKYTEKNKNASATAESMGMPRSSLYSIFNRLKIDVKEQ